jgi:ferrous iron transport protein B
MWFLMSFPAKTKYSKDFETQIAYAEETYRQGINSLEEKNLLISAAKSEMAFENLEYSFAGRIGHAMEPIIRPLGFDWRLGISIFSGFVAKEVIVSTMATVYGMADANESSDSLKSRISSDPAYSRLSAFAFLVFVLLYMPCMAAVAVFWRESGSFPETVFQIILTGGLAYFITLVIYQAGMALRF